MTDYPILSGAEPLFLEGSDVGCLISHGYTGSPQSMRFLGEYLAGEGGYTVSIPRLPGHGTSPEDMRESTAEQWVACIHEALHGLTARCSKLFVLGLSMGGTLALHTAASYPDRIQGVVTVNTPAFIQNPDMAGLALQPGAPDYVPGIGADLKDPEADELAYDQIPVASIKHLFGLVYVTQNLLPRITAPLLAFQSDEDHVVDPGNGPYILERVSATDKDLVRLDNSYHVATLDFDKERIARESLGFIQRHA